MTNREQMYCPIDLPAWCFSWNVFQRENETEKNWHSRIFDLSHKAHCQIIENGFPIIIGLCLRPINDALQWRCEDVVFSKSFSETFNRMPSIMQNPKWQFRQKSEHKYNCLLCKDSGQIRVVKPIWRPNGFGISDTSGGFLDFGGIISNCLCSKGDYIINRNDVQTEKGKY